MVTLNFERFDSSLSHFQRYCYVQTPKVCLYELEGKRRRRHGRT